MPARAAIRNQRRFLPRVRQRDLDLRLGKAALAAPRGLIMAAAAIFALCAAVGFVTTVADASDAFSLLQSGE